MANQKQLNCKIIDGRAVIFAGERGTHSVDDIPQSDLSKYIFNLVGDGTEVDVKLTSLKHGRGLIVWIPSLEN